MQWIRMMLGGVCLLFTARGRMTGPWWAWRRETAFGDHTLVPTRTRRHAVQGFLAWSWMMRRH